MNSKRNIQLNLRVTEEEKKIIDDRMKQLNIKSRNTYLRKSALETHLFMVDLEPVKQLASAHNYIGKNINQIVKFMHIKQNFTQKDFENIQNNLENLHQETKNLYRKLLSISEILGALRK